MKHALWSASKKVENIAYSPKLVKVAFGVGGESSVDKASLYCMKASRTLPSVSANERIDTGSSRRSPTKFGAA